MKSLLIIMLVIISSFSYSQSAVSIVKDVDEMTGEVLYLPSYKLVIHNQDKTCGFTIQPFVDNNLTLKSLIVKSINIGSCVKESTLIIRFANKQTYTLFAWNDFNCECISYFDLTPDIINEMSKSRIDKIRFSNGYTYDEYTGQPAVNELDYFMKICSSLFYRKKSS